MMVDAAKSSTATAGKIHADFGIRAGVLSSLQLARKSSACATPTNVATGAERRGVLFPRRGR
jgi:hypothetical protein